MWMRDGLKGVPARNDSGAAACAANAVCAEMERQDKLVRDLPFLPSIRVPEMETSPVTMQPMRKSA